MRLLSRREYSRQELQNRLQSKGYDADLIQDVLEDLTAKDWQNDQRFAESYARQRIGKGYGPLRIDNELRQRGIKSFDLDNIIEDATGGWMALLEQVYTKKYSNDTGISRTEWSRRNRFLLQRGFTGESIHALFKKLKINCE